MHTQKAGEKTRAREVTLRNQGGTKNLSRCITLVALNNNRCLDEFCCWRHSFAFCSRRARNEFSHAVWFELEVWRKQGWLIAVWSFCCPLLLYAVMDACTFVIYHQYRECAREDNIIHFGYKMRANKRLDGACGLRDFGDRQPLDHLTVQNLCWWAHLQFF